MLNPKPDTILNYRVFTMQQYQLVDDIADREIFMVYVKDFMSPDEYEMKCFDGDKEHTVKSDQEQLDLNNLAVVDFVQIAAEELKNKMAL